MWPIKERENIVGKFYSLQQAVEMCRYSSLTNLNPSSFIVADQNTIE